MKKIIILILFLNMVLPQCNEGYTFFENIPETATLLNTSDNCFLNSNVEVLENIIVENNLDENSVLSIVNQTWNSGELKILVATYSGTDEGIGLNNKLSSLPSNFGNLSSLVHLYLEWHELTSLPNSFTELPSLKNVYLNNNKLTTLPESIGDLTSLEILDVGYNEITLIPESIGEILPLEYLWIFNNQLTSLPESICNLNLDWNNTDGSSDNYPYFASGGNYLCVDIPSCIEDATFFNTSLDQFYYSFQITTPQDCECNCPDCNGICPGHPGYGSSEDMCGVCDDNPNNDCDVDCLGIWGGFATLDECGVCDGDGSTCAEYGTLSPIEQEDGSWNIDYYSPWDMGAFTFMISNASGYNEGIGDALSNGYIITINNGEINGFSLSGGSIPAGSGTLLNINVDNDPLTIENISINNAEGSSALNFYFINDTPCSETDCNGDCNGIAIIDECGICTLEITKASYYEDSDCDGLGNPNVELSSCFAPTGYVINNSDINDEQYCEENVFDECEACNGDNSSCTGCMDSIACNFDENATINGVCEYAENNFNCDGNCIIEIDCLGECGGTAVIDDCDICGNGCFEQDCVTYPLDEYDCEGQPLSISGEIPINYSLAQNYPNPFNPNTTISYSIPRMSNIELSIYNLKGEKIEQLVNSNQQAGNYSVKWNSQNSRGVQLPSGIYIYKLIAGDKIFINKMVLLK